MLRSPSNARKSITKPGIDPQRDVKPTAKGFSHPRPKLCVRALLDDAVEFHPEVTLAGCGLLDVEPAF